MVVEVGASSADGAVSGRRVIPSPPPTGGIDWASLDAGHDRVAALAAELEAALATLHRLQEAFERAVGAQRKALRALPDELTEGDGGGGLTSGLGGGVWARGLVGGGRVLGEGAGVVAEAVAAADAAGPPGMAREGEVGATPDGSGRGGDEVTPAAAAGGGSSGGRGGVGGAANGVAPAVVVTTVPGQSAVTGARRRATVRRYRALLAGVSALEPATGGGFVRLFLGMINVRFARRKERVAFKGEYEGLKLTLAPIFVVASAACFALPAVRWLHMLLQLALVYYYVSLALRENILRANGSNIKRWWIIHHYMTLAQGVVLLTWQPGPSYGHFSPRLHAFGVYNAVLQILQTRYQMARLYALRSLGRVGEMDVASSDGTQIHWSESMRFLIGFILLGHGIQLYLAVALAGIWRLYPSEVHAGLCGALFFATFVGNFVTTLRVLHKGTTPTEQT
ncbi:hypothetical protein MMPV_006056 [Pyropia vietnamensis]